MRYAAAGARIGLIARDAPALEALARDVEAAGGEALCLPLDVADAQAVVDAADEVERKLGPIDAWINNAMATVVGRVMDTPANEIQRVTDVTYMGYVHGTVAALRHMLPRDQGVIVQVGSALAYRGIPLQAAYCAAKHAIRGFTDSLRSELIHDGSRVRLTAVHLPAINTPQFDWARAHTRNTPRPVAPVYAPDVAARAIVRAARHPRRESWLGSNTRLTILGDMLLPGFLDRYLSQVAFDGQQTAQALPTDRSDNLFSPAAGKHRVSGSFGDEAKRHALDLPGSVVRIAAVLGACGMAVALTIAATAIANAASSRLR
jgi:NAD(P)-dependent dehydrogenase (short-subunit alcohol dehydrogenase family)